MASKVNHTCAKRSIYPPAHSNLSRIRLGMTFQCKYTEQFKRVQC